jgi:hypothetical protein
LGRELWQLWQCSRRNVATSQGSVVVVVPPSGPTEGEPAAAGAPPTPAPPAPRDPGDPIPSGGVAPFVGLPEQAQASRDNAASATP